MSEHESQPDAGGAADNPVRELDLSAYRTTELTGSLTELLSVPVAVTRFLFWAICGAAGTLSWTAWLTWDDSLYLIVWLVLLAFAAVAGLVCGAGVGMLRVLSRAMHNVEAVLRFMLQLTGRIAAD